MLGYRSSLIGRAEADDAVGGGPIDHCIRSEFDGRDPGHGRAQLENRDIDPGAACVGSAAQRDSAVYDPVVGPLAFGDVPRIVTDIDMGRTKIAMLEVADAMGGGENELRTDQGSGTSRHPF